MFGIFEKKYFLGVDFGNFSIKAVEVKVEGGKAQLVNFGIADIHDDGTTGVSNTVSHEARRRQYLSALLQRMQPKTKEICVSIPGSSGLIAVVEFPRMSEKEMAEAVQFEAHKYVPIDMNDVVLSWDVLKKSKEKEREKKKSPYSSGMEQVLLVAALKKDVKRAAEAVQSIGYSVGAMELEIFSLARSLVGKESGTHIIVDIGFRVSNLVVVCNGEVCINRTVDVGGGDITKTIADGMSVSFDRAEELKKQKDFFHQMEIPLTFPSIDIILSEIRRVLATFSQQHPNMNVESLLLSGGSASLPGLEAYFTEQTGIPSEKGDAWKRIDFSGVQVDPSAKGELGMSLAIALGLALRGIEIGR